MNKIKSTIEYILKTFLEKNFKLFIKALLTLREEIIKVDPEQMNPALVDFGMDQEMFEGWAISSIDKEPSEYNWEAAGFIIRDLQDILNNL